MKDVKQLTEKLDEGAQRLWQQIGRKGERKEVGQGRSLSWIKFSDQQAMRRTTGCLAFTVEEK